MTRRSHWSRRRFLTARGFGASAGGLIGAVMTEQALAPIDADQRTQHWCFSRRAMGCEFTVYLPPTTPDAMAVAEAALDQLDQIEDLLTIYRADSAVAYLNQHAASGPVRVDDRLFRLIERSARLTEQTGGAFDVSAGALVRAWGFVHGPKRVPDEAQRQAALACTGMRHIEIEAHEKTVRFRQPGLELNFGGIGKGLAIDYALRRITEKPDIDRALIQGGRSSVLGFGSPGGDGQGWLVGIQDPSDPTRRVATIRLRDRALGTSGAANQYFEVDGHRYGHVLDPRTGWPVGTDDSAHGLASASVIAPDAATADALSTALFAMGLDKAADFCHNHPRIGALLVTGQAPSDAIGRQTPRVATFNLPPEDVQLGPGGDTPGA